MGNFLMTTIVVIMINVLMFISQSAIIEINPNGPTCYNVKGSIIGEQITTQTDLYNQSVLNNNYDTSLPTSNSYQNTPTSGSNILSDLFNSMLSWIYSKTGLNYIVGVLSAPYNILKCMNLPNTFVIALGTLWYLISLLIIVLTIFWRE